MNTSTTEDAPQRVELREEVRKQLRGLTKAQRPLIINGCVSGDFSMQTVRALIGKGLMYLRIDSPNGRAGFVELTALGKEVQAAIRQLAPQPEARS